MRTGIEGSELRLENIRSKNAYKNGRLKYSSCPFLCTLEEDRRVYVQCVVFSSTHTCRPAFFMESNRAIENGITSYDAGRFSSLTCALNCTKLSTS